MNVYIVGLEGQFYATQSQLEDLIAGTDDIAVSADAFDGDQTREVSGLMMASLQAVARGTAIMVESNEHLEKLMARPR